MAFSQSTQSALARVAAGETPYAAAKAEGLASSTIYSALKRIRNGDVGGKKNSAVEPKKTVSIVLSETALQRCQAAADQLGITRYKFLTLAVLEQCDRVLLNESIATGNKK